MVSLNTKPVQCFALQMLLCLTFPSSHPQWEDSQSQSGLCPIAAVSADCLWWGAATPAAGVGFCSCSAVRVSLTLWSQLGAFIWAGFKCQASAGDRSSFTFESPRVSIVPSAFCAQEGGDVTKCRQTSCTLPKVEMLMELTARTLWFVEP